MKVNISREVGYVGELAGLEQGTKLQGYYQTYRYMQNIKPDILQLIKIDNPTQWLLHSGQEISNASSVAIHVRRGDYIQLSHMYGLLSSVYYEECIRRVKSVMTKPTFFVFSDDISDAKKLLEGLDDQMIFVSPPDGTHAFESIILMSACKAHIISNSTFAWWGAALAKESTITLFPQPWYRGLPAIKDLTFPNWNGVTATWDEA